MLIASFAGWYRVLWVCLAMDMWIFRAFSRPRAKGDRDKVAKSTSETWVRMRGVNERHKRRTRNGRCWEVDSPKECSVGRWRMESMREKKDDQEEKKKKVVRKKHGDGGRREKREGKDDLRYISDKETEKERGWAEGHSCL